MGAESLFGSPVGAAAATALVLSPRARRVARQGAVYGVAGVLKAGDVIVGAGRGLAAGVAEGAAGQGRDGDAGAAAGAAQMQAKPPGSATPRTAKR